MAGSTRQFIVKQDTFLHRARGVLMNEDGTASELFDLEPVGRESGTVVKYVTFEDGSCDFEHSEVAPTLVAQFDDGDAHALSMLEEVDAKTAKKQAAAVEDFKEKPWADYDDLTADQIVERLGDADQNTIASVEAYEGKRGDKARKTVLAEVERLKEEG